MAKNKPVWTFETLINGPAKDLEQLLFNIREGDYPPQPLPFLLKDRGACTITKDEDKFTVFFKDGHKEYLSIRNHSVSVQGQWWYRGTYTLKIKGGKTLLKLEIFNVAQKFRWAASLMILPEKPKHRSDFDEFARALEQAIR